MPPEDDIPVAQRDRPDVRRRSRTKLISVIIGLSALGASALGISWLVSTPKPQPNTASSTGATSISGYTPPSPKASNGDRLLEQSPNSGENSPGNRSYNEENLLGHLPYKEAPASALRPIAPGSQIKLRTVAAQKFQAMSAAAARDGVSLVPISGFRSVSEQQHVFFDVKAQRGQVATKRAEVSAPPGYSEHHTGYAVDIGDGRSPATNLNPNFEKTAAFKWLMKNSAYYSFELSFPKNNPHGVSYEPWHWRFVGDRDSLETFYKAKNLIRPGSTPATESSPTLESTSSTESSPTPGSTPATESSPTPESTSSTESSPTPESTSSTAPSSATP